MVDRCTLYSNPPNDHRMIVFHDKIFLWTFAIIARGYSRMTIIFLAETFVGEPHQR